MISGTLAGPECKQRARHSGPDAVTAATYGWPDSLEDEVISERLLALDLQRAASPLAQEAAPYD